MKTRKIINFRSAGLYIILIALILLLSPGILLSAQGKKDKPGVTTFRPDGESDPTEKGLVIVHVFPDSPAEKAGIKRGDILIQVEGQEVNTVFEVRKILSERKAGGEISMLVQHGEDMKKVSLRLEDRLYRPAVGLEFAAPFEGGFDLQIGKGGALIREVVKGSPADTAGLKSGDLITGIDGNSISPDNDLAGLIASHKPGDTITLKADRAGEKNLEFKVQLGEGENSKPYLGIRYVPWYGELGRFPFTFERGHMQFFNSGPKSKRIIPRIKIEGNTLIITENPAAI
ncbi:MAG: PDZ domain-containing protein [Spirochaetota bacterium]